MLEVTFKENISLSYSCYKAPMVIMIDIWISTKSQQNKHTLILMSLNWNWNI